MLLRGIAMILALAPTGAAIAQDPPIAPALGVTADTATITAHDDFIFPDGDGLPAGSGTVTEGRQLYRQHCLRCHGDGGRGGSGGELAGGRHALTSATPDKTIGRYWPYATTLFAFVRRAMPLDAPGRLTNDECYALVAYLLFENDVVAKDITLDAAALAAVRMPNRDGFLPVEAPAP